MDNLETKNIDWSIIDAFFSSNKYYFNNTKI
jgi:hypothetical protein